MTIAAGLVCTDGIVMCADSQESYGDYKWPVEKLLIDEKFGFPLIIAGAGFGPAIDNAAQRIADRLRGGFGDPAVVEDHIRSILRDICENDLAHYPINNLNDTAFALLVALRTTGKGFPRLYETSGSLIKRVKHFAIIGSGGVITSFAHDLYKKGPFGSIVPLGMGKIIAAYLAYLAKVQLSSVGGRSEIATLDDEGEISYAKLWEAPQWERFFGQYERLQGELMLATANPLITAESFAKKVSEFSAAVIKHKTDLLEEAKAWEEIFGPYPADRGQKGGKT